MSHVVSDEIKDVIREQEAAILEDLDRLNYLLAVAKVWTTRGISLKEAYRQIDELKIKFAIVEN